MAQKHTQSPVCAGVLPSGQRPPGAPSDRFAAQGHASTITTPPGATRAEVEVAINVTNSRIDMRMRQRQIPGVFHGVVGA